VIDCEDHLQNDLYCVEWGVKLYSNQPTSRLCGAGGGANVRSVSRQGRHWRTSACDRATTAPPQPPPPPPPRVATEINGNNTPILAAAAASEFLSVATAGAVLVVLVVKPAAAEATAAAAAAEVEFIASRRQV